MNHWSLGLYAQATWINSRSTDRYQTNFVISDRRNNTVMIRYVTICLGFNVWIQHICQVCGSKQVETEKHWHWLRYSHQVSHQHPLRCSNIARNYTLIQGDSQPPSHAVELVIWKSVTRTTHSISVRVTSHWSENSTDYSDKTTSATISTWQTMNKTSETADQWPDAHCVICALSACYVMCTVVVVPGLGIHYALIVCPIYNGLSETLKTKTKNIILCIVSIACIMHHNYCVDLQKNEYSVV